ncbi:MAG TPA: DUF4352 domain-containing protein [Candidatus Thermoplasmatota archaeon]|nr:DUF4352 domain-containing protein [Candidatus Thermoplasmatota archaeon]
MKASLVVALVSAAAVPAAIQSGVTPIDPISFDGDGDLFARAEKMAQEQFAAEANLSVLEVHLADKRIGTFGETIKPDPGYVFHVANVRLQNTGKVDIAVSSWHFSATDESGSDHSIEMANAHEDFDGARLGKGLARNGQLIFELPRGSFIAGMHWQGDLGSANATAPAYEH